jgi:hypothetical protein
MIGHIQDVSTSKFSFFKLYVVDQAITRVVTRLCTDAEYLRKKVPGRSRTEPLLQI